MTSVSSEPPGGGRLQQPNMSALVVSAQKKRALELLESQFGSASASSASSSSSSSSSQGASKKPKQASGSTNASHQAASNAQSLRAPEEAPFYAALARPGATSQFSFSAAAPVQGRQKLQTLVEELLPTASLFNKIANSRVLVLENPQRTLTGEAIAERTLKRRAGNARRQMMSAQQRKACHWTQLDPRGMTCVRVARGLFS